MTTTETAEAPLLSSLDLPAGSPSLASAYATYDGLLQAWQQYAHHVRRGKAREPARWEADRRAVIEEAAEAVERAASLVAEGWSA